MNISAPFIYRPIATTLLVVAIVLLGMLGYRFLSVAALPTVEFPTIQVVTNWPGAAPDIVQSAISAPLEAGFGRIPGLTLMTSTSSFGTSQITLQFKLTRPIAAAAQDVQSAINAAAGWLPTNQLPFPPTYHQVNPADMPVLVIALTSDTMPLHAITEFAATALIPKLSQVEGVGEVSVQGDQARAVRLQVNPRQLAALGLSLEDVRKAISSTTVAMPKGQIEGPRNAFQVGANDQLFDAAAFRDAIIAYRNGAPVKFKDIGETVDGLENDQVAAWYQRQAGAHPQCETSARVQYHPGRGRGQSSAPGAAENSRRALSILKLRLIAPRPSAPRLPTFSGRSRSPSGW